ncbi:protein-cysteine N-palmitoyltransferase Rasp isoform X1 [Rhipicephalus microplus]|uniref:protein-cysteine N-palmitoyltransferase Rasp isoform X1 n=1 Tax=Rhipicephalus microplus TaxID=6941 RepID=UPI003F6AE0AE
MCDRRNEAPCKRGPEFQRWRWTPEKVYHWVVYFGATMYVFWRFATTEQNAYILEQTPESFSDGSYGFQRKQDIANWEWQTTKYMVVTAWKWYLLHPILAQLTAYATPSMMPVFYAAYSSLFVTIHFGWEVTLLFVGQHAAFYLTATLHSTALCYVVAAAIHLQKIFLPSDPYDYMYSKYGHMAYGAVYVAFLWNVLRGLSFSVDFVKSEQRKNDSDINKRRWPPYWKTLGYLLYMPMLYLGPPQVYDDFVNQSEKPKPTCTAREVTIAVARIVRCGAHFLLMEIMAHFFYSSAMAEKAWMGERLDYPSLVGYALSLEFNYYMCYLFTYGFSGALAKAEGIEIPGTAPCIARLHRCSQFWRYFDRGMHLLIRRYVYEPVLAGKRTASRRVVGTAVAFSFTITWHCYESNSAVWCALSALGVALEVIAIEIRKWTPVKKFEGRFLASPERMRMAKCLLGSPHFVLTMCACIFHLAEVDVCFVICKRILTGFPFPVVPVLVVIYSGCHVSLDVAEWEASANSKQIRSAP